MPRTEAIVDKWTASTVMGTTIATFQNRDHRNELDEDTRAENFIEKHHMKNRNTRIRDAYSEPAYRAYAPGAHISHIGTWMQRIAQDWLVLGLTGGSAAALGLVTTLQLLPTLLVGPLAGLMADRFDRRRLLIALQTTSLLTSGLLAAAVLAGAHSLAMIFVAATISGVVAGIEGPTRATFLHDLAGREKIATVVALESGSGNVARLSGPALAGLLIAAAGPGWALAANSASFLAVLVSTLLVGKYVRRSTTDRPATASWSEALSMIARRRDLAAVLGLMAVTGMFSFNMILMIPIMATEVFEKSAAGFGLLTSVTAVGSVIGAAVAARRSSLPLRTVVVATIVLGFAIALTSTAPSYVVFALLLPIVGFTQVATSTAALGYLQLSTPDHLRGRIIATQMMVLAGCGATSGPLVGLLADSFGARAAITGLGAATVIGALVVASAYLLAKGLTVRPRINAAHLFPRLVVVERLAI